MWQTHADKVPLSERTGGTDNKLKTSCFETHLQWSVEWVESFCLKLQNIQWLWIHEVPEKNHSLIETLQPRFFNRYYQPLNYQGGYLNLAHVYEQHIIWTEKITYWNKRNFVENTRYYAACLKNAVNFLLA